MTYGGYSHRIRFIPQLGFSVGIGYLGGKTGLLYYFDSSWESTSIEINYSTGSYHPLVSDNTDYVDYMGIMQSVNAMLQFRLANLSNRIGINVTVGGGNILSRYLGPEEVYNDQTGNTEVIGENWSPDKWVFNFGISFSYISSKFKYY